MQPLWKTVWNFFKKLKMKLPFNLAIPLVLLHLKNPETLVQKNVCTPMFIAAQFTIAKFWKPPRCPSVNECIKKFLNIYTIGILHRRKKAGTPILRDSMDRTGEYCVK